VHDMAAFDDDVIVFGFVYLVGRVINHDCSIAQGK
jgi:hypothetical protein